MERQPQRVFDPMFSPRVARQHVPAYIPRQAQYVSTQHIADIRAKVATKSTPNVPKMAPTPLTQTEATSKATPTDDTSNGEASAQRRNHFKPLSKQSVILYGMAAFVFTVGLLVSLNGLHTNHQVEAQVKHSQKQTSTSVADNVVPSTVKPSAVAVQNYAVSPNIPKYLDIPKLKIHTRVLSEGVTKSGQLQVPWNIYDTGWYNASSQPGQVGGMLIDGHSGIGVQHGVFYKLNSLVSGDIMTVTRGDNKQFTYTVVKVQTLNVNAVDMSDMLVSADTSKPGLNLITCAGEQIPGTDQLNERVEVYAIQQ